MPARVCISISVIYCVHVGVSEHGVPPKLIWFVICFAWNFEAIPQFQSDRRGPLRTHHRLQPSATTQKQIKKFVFTYTAFIFTFYIILYFISNRCWYHWIGSQEILQESPMILMVKTMVSGRFSQPINPMMINLTCHPQSLRPQMNLVNLSTALHRVAKIVGNDAWLQAPNTLGRSGWRS